MYRPVFRIQVTFCCCTQLKDFIHRHCCPIHYWFLCGYFAKFSLDLLRETWCSGLNWSQYSPPPVPQHRPPKQQMFVASKGSKWGKSDISHLQAPGSAVPAVQSVHECSPDEICVCILLRWFHNQSYL